MTLSADMFHRKRSIPRVGFDELDPPGHRAYLDAGQPYIGRGFVAPGARGWTFASLRARVGHVRSHCLVSEDGHFLLGNDANLDPVLEPGDRSTPHGRYHTLTMSLAEAVDQIEVPHGPPLIAPGETLYWYGGALPRALCPDLQPLPAVIERDMGPPGLWLSQAGAVTSMHYDTAPGFLLQLRGRKRVTLLPGEVRLPEYPVHDRRGRHVRVADWARLLDEDPELADAECWEGIVEPGEVIFLPSFVWHQVESLEHAISVSIPTIIPEIDECVDAIRRLFGPDGPVIRTPPSVRNALFHQLRRIHRV